MDSPPFPGSFSGSPAGSFHSLNVSAPKGTLMSPRSRAEDPRLYSGPSAPSAAPDPHCPLPASTCLQLWDTSHPGMSVTNRAE